MFSLLPQIRLSLKSFGEFYRLSENYPQSVFNFTRKNIIRIENAITTEKYPEPSFLKQNAM
jgi:hypothetical protein